MIKVLTFEEYAAGQGASRQGFGDAGLHMSSRHVSARKKKAAIARQLKRDQELSDRRKALREQYALDVAEGRVRPPTSLETLEAQAAGDPDKESTQAAIRVLAKRRACEQAGRPRPRIRQP